MVELLNIDCMEIMPRYSDNHFDLAIVDPPYGINISQDLHKRGISCSKNGYRRWDFKAWDSCPPNDKYFDELFRVSKNQIIWGGNYFDLPPTRCYLVWNKVQRKFSFADGELAWTSFDKSLRIFDYSRGSALNNSKLDKIHPTQKPIKLYEWLLINNAKTGDKILDTHLGSGSIAIACHNYGFDLVGCEIDKEYYDKMMIRYNNRIAQQDLFTYDDIYRN